ncbi:hypothetical protein [Halapricum desulfuricans]|uniref:Uncharacterized protein n=1 Tax=Halapricum desulfuricans TaxID=2841257 RepID=A0A897MVT6_9EURY|nr:hypothetical protein [Halapricum desulfuricans]QSG04391.1 hypothetical protein HSR121_0030 [Halapricum desulfuricans]
MSNRDTTLTRRRVLLGTAGVATVLAGCSGSDTPANGGDTDQDGGDPTPTATPDSAGQTSDSTTTQSPTQTADDETTAPDGPDSVCTPLAGSPTAYDVSGTPYVFAFDYPETWTVGDPIPGQNGRFQQIMSPDVTVDGYARTATVRIGQSSAPLSASEVEAEKDKLTTRETDPLAVVDEQTFDGETLEVLGFPDVPPSNYPPAYVLFLPYGSGGSREYYRTSIVTYSDVYGLEDEGRDACNERIRTATETVRNSLRPNPETTIKTA